MSWKKILILLGVITVIHLILIFGVIRGSTGEKTVETETGRSAGEVVESSPAGEKKNTVTEKTVVRKPERKVVPVRKVSPWKYGKNPSLPGNLAKQSERAKSVILVDLESRRVLWEKNSRKAVPVASLTKLMTALLVAERVELNQGISLDAPVEISPVAAAVEGRRFNAGETLLVKDLIAAMMICSANDAATQLAQTVGGKVDDFVKLMNERAGKMGLSEADFNSPSGLPQGKKRVNSIASAADILHLCQALMKHPSIMNVCGESYAKLSNGKEIFATNGLLKHPTKARPHWRKVPGLFGFKTGYTKAAGCCLAFGVTRGGRTVLGCVTGFPSSADRERFCSDLIEWAYRK